MQRIELKRRINIEGFDYFIQVRRSEPRHIDRFATRCYAIVELPEHWQATVPVPDCIRDTGHLWYRELIELVHHALAIVQRRSAAVA